MVSSSTTLRPVQDPWDGVCRPGKGFPVLISTQEGQRPKRRLEQPAQKEPETTQWCSLSRLTWPLASQTNGAASKGPAWPWEGPSAGKRSAPSTTLQTSTTFPSVQTKVVPSWRPATQPHGMQSYTDAATAEPSLNYRMKRPHSFFEARSTHIQQVAGLVDHAGSSCMRSLHMGRRLCSPRTSTHSSSDDDGPEIHAPGSSEQALGMHSASGPNSRRNDTRSNNGAVAMRQARPQQTEAGPAATALRRKHVRFQEMPAEDSTRGHTDGLNDTSRSSPHVRLNLDVPWDHGQSVPGDLVQLHCNATVDALDGPFQQHLSHQQSPHLNPQAAVLLLCPPLATAKDCSPYYDACSGHDDAGLIRNLSPEVPGYSAVDPYQLLGPEEDLTSPKRAPQPYGQSDQLPFPSCPSPTLGISPAATSLPSCPSPSFSASPSDASLPLCPSPTISTSPADSSQPQLPPTYLHQHSYCSCEWNDPKLTHISSRGRSCMRRDSHASKRLEHCLDWDGPEDGSRHSSRPYDAGQDTSSCKKFLSPDPQDCRPQHAQHLAAFHWSSAEEDGPLHSPTLSPEQQRPWHTQQSPPICRTSAKRAVQSMDEQLFSQDAHEQDLRGMKSSSDQGDRRLTCNINWQDLHAVQAHELVESYRSASYSSQGRCRMPLERG